MTDSGNRYALHALRERRAAIDGEFRRCEQRLRHHREMLGHLDATLSLFDPDGNPKAIKAKRPYNRVKLFAGGKLNRLILDAMRRADRPMTTLEIVAAVVEDLNFGEDAAKGMKSRVRSSLLYLWKVRGSVVKEGEREMAMWRLA
jgi:hypothetical protein